MSKEQKKEYVAVGGQALMEGIMMRGPKGTAVSYRLPNGRILTEMKEFVSVRKKYKPLNLPLVRGVVSFVESMIFGYKLLMESAEKTSLDFEQDANESKLDRWLSDHFGPKMLNVIGVIAMVLGVGLAFLLFMWLPSFLFDLLRKAAHSELTTIRPVFEGLIRIIVFIAYMFIVSRTKEIHRVFMYHGAEHKTIDCFERGWDLTVENVRKSVRFHPRCGTSFIFVTIILSILISSIVALIFPQLTVNRGIWLLTKLLILPLIMGVGFEFIQLAGKYQNTCTRILSAPGLLMQRITTAEPDDAIIECGIAVMQAALTGEIPPEQTQEVIDAETAAQDVPADEEAAPEEAQEPAAPQEPQA